MVLITYKLLLGSIEYSVVCRSVTALTWTPIYTYTVNQKKTWQYIFDYNFG